MKQLLAFAILGGLTLTGCVTTEVGGISSGASPSEAAQANLDLGISYLKKGDLDQALIKLKKSESEEPDNATTHRVLGIVYEQLGDLPMAEKEYRAAVRLAPDDPDALDQLGVYLCQKGEARAGLKYFDRAIAIPRMARRAEILTNAGNCAKSVDLERAENYLRRALADAPNNPYTLYQMGDVAFRRENFLQARAFVERRLSVAPPAPNVLWLGYRVEYALDDNVAAETYAAGLLADFPESVEARLLLELMRDAG